MPLLCPFFFFFLRESNEVKTRSICPVLASVLSSDHILETTKKHFRHVCCILNAPSFLYVYLFASLYFCKDVFEGAVELLDLQKLRIFFMQTFCNGFSKEHHIHENIIINSLSSHSVTATAQHFFFLCLVLMSSGGLFVLLGFFCSFWA